MDDMDRQLVSPTSDDEATNTSSVVVQAAPTVPETGSPSLSELVSDVGVLRTRARLISYDLDETSHDVAQLHRDVREERLVEETRSVAKRSAESLLDDLSERGFSWRDIARMVRVSVPAVKKWRRGEAISGENRYRLAAVCALCEILDEELLIDDLATWFEIPIDDASAVTPIDLVVAGRLDLVQEHAHENVAPSELLDEYDPTWRERRASDFEVVRADDGMMSIRSKDMGT